MYVNKYFEQEAKDREFYSEDLMTYLAEGGSLQDRTDVPNDVKEIYITSPELLPEEHVLMQAAFQPYVDSGISKTINMPNDATVQDVWDTYMLAWKTECKGITVYRAGSREKEILVKGIKNEDVTFDCCENPKIIYESGCHKCLSCDWSACEIA
jgi:ribonucleoside-diphosphate reductase alpha chain